MMESPNKKINELVPNLPKKDIDFANKFIAARDFQSLKMLVDSAIYKIKKSLASESPKEEYVGIDLEKLYTLQSTVNAYLILIGDADDEIYDNEAEEALDCQSIGEDYYE